MKKGQINFNIIIILAIIIAISILSFAVIAQSGKEPVIDGETKNKIECTVDLKENLFGEDVKIENLECVAISKCSFGKLSIFSTKGNVEMLVGGVKIDSAKFETGTFDGKDTVLLSACTSSPSGSVRVKSDSGEITDSKTWSVN